ncbi:putative SNF2 family N-terminal domain containing protein, partial [Klebsormidium nitens]
GSG